MAIDYKEYAKQLRENAGKDNNGVILCSPELWEEIASIIENIPTADVEEVVHCKDCKYSESNGGDCNGILPITYRDYVCEVNKTEYVFLGFCSYGERK